MYKLYKKRISKVSPRKSRNDIFSPNLERGLLENKDKTRSKKDIKKRSEKISNFMKNIYKIRRFTN